MAKSLLFCQRNMPLKQYIKRNKQKKWTLKMLGYQIKKKHNCNPFQSAPSLFIRYSFGSCWVIYTSSACSEQSFYVSPNLVAVPTVWILTRFVTQLPKSNLSVTFSHRSQGSSCIKAYRNLFYGFCFLPCSFIQLKIFSWFSEMPFPTDASNWKQKIYIICYIIC